MINLPQDDLPADMWLHVATDALARYITADEAEEVSIGFYSDGGMVIHLTGIRENDPRLAASFIAWFTTAEKTTNPTPDAPQEEEA